jgi:hypothetical protein
MHDSPLAMNLAARCGFGDRALKGDAKQLVSTAADRIHSELDARREPP